MAGLLLYFFELILAKFLLEAFGLNFWLFLGLGIFLVIAIMAFAGLPEDDDYRINYRP